MTGAIIRNRNVLFSVGDAGSNYTVSRSSTSAFGDLIFPSGSRRFGRNGVTQCGAPDARTPPYRANHPQYKGFSYLVRHLHWSQADKATEEI
jgi:hypothetical protein